MRKTSCFTQQRQSRCIQLSEPIVVLSLKIVKGTAPGYTTLHKLMIWGALNWSLRTKKLLNTCIFCAGFTLSCLRQPAEPWPGYTVLPECQPDNILKDNGERRLPHGNLVENIYISPLTPLTKRSTLWDLVLAVTSQCYSLVLTSQCPSTKEKVNFKKCPASQKIS